MKRKKKLFTVTSRDLTVQTFRSGGKGGQHQNKRNTGVRIIHPDSGAVGESRTERSQYQNRKLALERLASSDKFRAWIKIRAAEATGRLEEIEKRVDRMMHPRNLRIEHIGPDGRWQLLEEDRG